MAPECVQHCVASAGLHMGDLNLQLWPKLSDVWTQETLLAAFSKWWSHFQPWGKKKNPHNAAPPLLVLLLSLKLHRFQQRCTSSAGFDCTGLLAPSLHQWSCSLSKARRKTRTKAMTALYQTRQPAMDLTQRRAAVSAMVTQIYGPPVGLFVSCRNF